MFGHKFEERYGPWRGDFLKLNFISAEGQPDLTGDYKRWMENAYNNTNYPIPDLFPEQYRPYGIWNWVGPSGQAGMTPPGQQPTNQDVAGYTGDGTPIMWGAVTEREPTGEEQLVKVATGTDGRDIYMTQGGQMLIRPTKGTSYPGGQPAGGTTAGGEPVFSTGSGTSTPTDPNWMTTPPNIPYQPPATNPDFGQPAGPGDYFPQMSPSGFNPWQGYQVPDYYDPNATLWRANAYMTAPEPTPDTITGAPTWTPPPSIPTVGPGIGQPPYINEYNPAAGFNVPGAVPTQPDIPKPQGPTFTWNPPTTPTGPTFNWNPNPILPTQPQGPVIGWNPPIPTPGGGLPALPPGGGGGGGGSGTTQPPKGNPMGDFAALLAIPPGAPDPGPMAPVVGAQEIKNSPFGSGMMSPQEQARKAQFVQALGHYLMGGY